MILLRLFFEYFKIGLFSVGGGLATIPFLYDLSSKTGWFSYEQLSNMIAISESTPGPIGVNMTTYVGHMVAGIPGSLCATIGLVTPSVVIILIIIKVLEHFKNSSTIDSVFYGLRPASVALIAAAGVEVAKVSIITLDRYMASQVLPELFNIKACILAIVIFAILKIFKPHPLYLLAISAVCGIVFQMAY